MEEKPPTLDDYTKQILQPMLKRCAENEVKWHEEWLKQAEFCGYKPPTRKQRIKYWLQDKKQRCKDIWTILSGGDVH